ncbi:hypothetical protein WG66_011370 [Moniliophthora roreri]|nr:hypothetical protein WG66_011370 [Moniliophthora roreri]
MTRAQIPFFTILRRPHQTRKLQSQVCNSRRWIWTVHAKNSLDFGSSTTNECYSEDCVAYWFRTVPDLTSKNIERMMQERNGPFRKNIDQPAFSNYDHLPNVTSQTTLSQANQYPVPSQVLQPPPY